MSADSPYQLLRPARFPLLPVTGCFVAGIVVSWSLDFPASAILQWSLLLVGVALLLLTVRRYRRQASRGVVGIGVLFFAFLLGGWRAGEHHLLNRSDHFGQLSLLEEDAPPTIALKIISIRPGDRSLRLTTEVTGLFSQDTTVIVSGKLLLYLPPTETAGLLTIGDELLVSGLPRRIEGPLNPYTFDGQAYWAGQNIFHRLYLREGSDWQRIGGDTHHWAARFSQWREAWIASFRPYLSGNELAVAAALILGKRDLLSDDLRNAYADTGAVHVLAVSGLHVGIVTFLLSWLLGLLPFSGKGWKVIKILLVLTGVWGFAAITGFSPSVQRSALMFSILAIGGLGSRGSHLFNSLAAAALLILILDPKQLFQVGFQLSFAAVAGIGLFQRWFEKRLFVPWRIGRSIWSVLSVSLAATLGTLPFSIYYFHQFPAYFLLTGSVVILTAYGALSLGLLHGAVSLFASFLAPVTGFLLNLVIGLQNSIILLGRSLPGARQETDWISVPEVLLLLFAIGAFALWIRLRNWWLPALALLALLVYGFVGLQSSKVLEGQQRTVLYHQRKASVIDVIRGHSALRIQTPDLDPENLKYTLENHVTAKAYKVDSTWYFPLYGNKEITGLAYSAPPLIDLAGRRWLVLDNQAEIPTISSNDSLQAIDFLLLTNQRGYFEVSNFPGFTERTQIILDGSASYTAIRQWTAARDAGNLRVHITAIDGAFILER